MLIDWERAPNDDLNSECRTSCRRVNSIEMFSELRKRSGRKRTTAKCFDWASRSDVLDSLSLRKAVLSRKCLCSLQSLRNWGPPLWRSYCVLKIRIVWLAPHSRPAANLQELMSWTLSRLLPIPSVVIGHWSSGNLSLPQTYPAWQSIEKRTMIVVGSEFPKTSFRRLAAHHGQDDRKRSFLAKSDPRETRIPRGPCSR